MGRGSEPSPTSREQFYQKKRERAEPVSATGAPHKPSERCRRIAAGRQICVTAEKGQQP